MNKKQADQWAKTREKGLWHFVFFTGVLVWGGVTALIWSAFLSVLTEKGFVGALTIAVPLSMITGFLWGIFAWRKTNSRYNTYQATQDETP